MTVAPHLLSKTEISRPIPLPAPVTRTRFPLKLIFIKCYNLSNELLWEITDLIESSGLQFSAHNLTRPHLIMKGAGRGGGFRRRPPSGDSDGAPSGMSPTQASGVQRRPIKEPPPLFPVSQQFYKSSVLGRLERRVVQIMII